MIEVEFKLPKGSLSIETLREKLPALHYPGLHVHRLFTWCRGCVACPPTLQKHQLCKRNVPHCQLQNLFCVTSRLFLQATFKDTSAIQGGIKANSSYLHYLRLSLISVLFLAPFPLPSRSGERTALVFPQN